ncbi:hypothetical protein IF2G_07202 [Cordyceps javanica]|nr:hypothetical protein IF2G_07202 [Cordyceps javanica]
MWAFSPAVSRTRQTKRKAAILGSKNQPGVYHLKPENSSAQRLDLAVYFTIKPSCTWKWSHDI